VPSTPPVTPGDGIGASTVLAFLAVATFAGIGEVAQCLAIVAAAAVAYATVRGHADLRIVRNATEIAKLKAGE